MTNDQIDLIILAREKITALRDWRGLESAVDALDTLLSDVPPGQRADVDALLGRFVLPSQRLGANTPQASPPGWIPKRVVLAQHVSGATEIDPTWAAQNEPSTDWRHIKGDLDL